MHLNYLEGKATQVILAAIRSKAVVLLQINCLLLLPGDLCLVHVLLYMYSAL